MERTPPPKSTSRKTGGRKTGAKSGNVRPFERPRGGGPKASALGKGAKNRPNPANAAASREARMRGAPNRVGMERARGERVRGGMTASSRNPARKASL